MRVVVIGLAATGSAVVDYARTSGHDVVVIEDHPEGDAYTERAARARDVGAVVHEQPDADNAAAIARACDLVVPSPGVRPDHPAIVAAQSAAVPVRAEIDLAAARLRARPQPARLVAVTGT